MTDLEDSLTMLTVGILLRGKKGRKEGGREREREGQKRERGLTGTSNRLN